MTELTLYCDPHAPLVPIEDLIDGQVVHSSQLRPTPLLNVEKAYDLAKSGLTIAGISAAMRISRDTLETHFGKTIKAAKAERAQEMLQKFQTAADNGDLAAASKLLDRLDPVDKEPAINLNLTQMFNGIQTKVSQMNLSDDDINDL